MVKKLCEEREYDRYKGIKEYLNDLDQLITELNKVDAEIKKYWKSISPSFNNDIDAASDLYGNIAFKAAEESGIDYTDCERKTSKSIVYLLNNLEEFVKVRTAFADILSKESNNYKNESIKGCRRFK